MTITALICGCAGLALLEEEKNFLKRVNPWGLILFKRNIDNPQQVSDLTNIFRKIVGRADAPVLVDQEGGRVQRLAAPHWRIYPPASVFSALDNASHEEQAELARLNARLIAQDLHAVGINVDCLPVLDVPVEGAHDVIGNRACGREPESVIRIGRAITNGLMQGGVLPVMKHIPGHGRAGADSHFDLPIVTTSRAELEAQDFAPFMALSDLPMAMTAHVVYTAIDPDNTATTSKVVIDSIIRGLMGFDGLLMSDDVSMKALGGTFEERTRRLFAAGCDIALHCNGRMDEMVPVASATPHLTGKALRRAEAALACLSAPTPFNGAKAWAKLEKALPGQGLAV